MGDGAGRHVGYRPATAADVAAVVALIESAYRGEEAARGWSSEAALIEGQRTDADEIAELIARPGNELVLAEEAGGDLLACFHLAQRPDRSAYFGMFAVRPDLQATGLGRRVLAEAERRAAVGGATTVVMAVISLRRELIAWYARRGYADTGRTEPFPYGDERKGRPRRPDLEFAVLEKGL